MNCLCNPKSTSEEIYGCKGISPIHPLANHHQENHDPIISSVDFFIGFDSELSWDYRLYLRQPADSILTQRHLCNPLLPQPNCHEYE
ncbi:hypothetical protein Ocin01_05527 [Orchesella cincta]|uniref:Uncharacterized protein n=1 Tax=Orchesella cincta TaxID=48709 RepID=A0A1D2N7G7_ORCCI|nr:hypothetical protein Ocin01_05527 [Orchesella cincta]